MRRDYVYVNRYSYRHPVSGESFKFNGRQHETRALADEAAREELAVEPYTQRINVLEIPK